MVLHNRASCSVCPDGDLSFFDGLRCRVTLTPTTADGRIPEAGVDEANREFVHVAVVRDCSVAYIDLQMI